MFPWFSRLSYWLLVRNLRLSWDRGGSLITLKTNVQCDFDTTHSRVLNEKLDWLQEWDETPLVDCFQLTFHDPAPPLWHLPPASRCHDVWEDLGCQASAVSWQSLWSMSADFSVSDSQAMTHSGQHRLWPTAEHNYYVSLNNQSATLRTTLTQQISNQWLSTILTASGQLSY